MNAEGRIERIKRQTIKLQADRELITQILSNPVAEIILAYLIIEYCQTHGEIVKDKWGRIDTDLSHPLIPAMAGSVAEAGVLVAVALQQGGLDLVKSAIAAGGASLSTLARLAPKALTVLK